MITEAKYLGIISPPTFLPFSEGTVLARRLHKEYERKLSLQWKLLWTPLFFPVRHANLQIELADCKQAIKFFGGHA